MNSYETKSIPHEIASGNYVELRNSETGETKLVLKAYFENTKKTNGADDTWLVQR
tara:strand:- start:5395 stop:5559 length:165 start_codon:yes stop_codon:yes gene_type:complete